MNGLTLVIAGFLILFIAYRYYGAFLATKVLMLEPARVTPAVRHNDGRDYVPTNRWITFGHHFAAIAGAGPLVGPVLAAQFGFLPGALWILIGAVVAGGVHDMVILFASIRHDGMSLAEIAKKELGTVSGFCTSVAIMFIVVIAMAGMGIAVVNALKDSAWGTFTVGATIPIAVFIGLYLRYLRPGKIREASVIGVLLVLAAVVGGSWVQHSSIAHYFVFNHHQLSVMLAVYGFIAAVLPVWLLLAPRDYLSSYMKIGTILLMAIGIILVCPQIRMPATTQFVHGGGPIIPGPAWPFMFITIACGALSGFHALISSGTTPKMLENEREILPVGYGAMLVEAFVSLMALIAATSLHPGDYFAINALPEVFAKLNMPVVDLPRLSMMVGENVAGRTGGAVSLAVGMANIFASIPGMKSLMSYWYHFAIMFEALFILTLIDAGTRVGRYILQEFAGKFYAPLKQTNWMPGILATSAAIAFAWGYLVYTGSIATIWPLLGVANQLIGALALAIGTTVLIRMGRARYTWCTLVPMVFLVVTTLSAGYLNITTNYMPKGNLLLSVCTGIMMGLVILVIVDAARQWRTMRSEESKDPVAVSR